MKKILFSLLLTLIFIFLIETIFFSGSSFVKNSTFKLSQDSDTNITLAIYEPTNPIDVEAILTSKAATDIPEAYLKSSVHECSSYEEWKRYVSDEYANALQVTLENFEVKKSLPRQIKKSGFILHWVTASNNHIEMLYIVERVKYRSDLPETVAIRNFIRKKGAWVAHIRDELNLVGKMQISDLYMLKNKVRKQ